MYGFWCRTWGYHEFDARVGGICARHLELPMERLNSVVKPVIDLYLAARLPPDAGVMLAEARAKGRKAPFERGSMHTEFWPYDTLAPELAYCQRLGLSFPAARGVHDFPDPAGLAVMPEVEEALVAVGCSRWGSSRSTDQPRSGENSSLGRKLQVPNATCKGRQNPARMRVQS
jgi:hypothetical protein